MKPVLHGSWRTEVESIHKVELWWWLIVVDQFSHAWAEEEEVGWEEDRGRGEAARVAEQAW